MPLTTTTPIAFIPTTNAAAARNFYETALGLNFVSDDNFALVFSIGPTQTMLRVVPTPSPSPPGGMLSSNRPQNPVKPPNPSKSSQPQQTQQDKTFQNLA
jgi:catechol 2,3-dioxygenase-like lactoylglutathione lyase family enzyme